jgi:hypothetical protein
MVSGLATRVMSFSALRPSRLAISASAALLDRTVATDSADGFVACDSRRSGTHCGVTFLIDEPRDEGQQACPKESIRA